ALRRASAHPANGEARRTLGRLLQNHLDEAPPPRAPRLVPVSDFRQPRATSPAPLRVTPPALRCSQSPLVGARLDRAECWWSWSVPLPKCAIRSLRSSSPKIAP